MVNVFGAHHIISAVGVNREGRKHILGLGSRRDGKRRRGEQQAQTLNLMRAAWKVTTPEEGEKRLEQLARFLERDYESAAPWLLTENRFRKVSGHRDLWALATILGPKTETEISQEKVA